jgi:hypothetical protein
MDFYTFYLGLDNPVSYFILPCSVAILFSVSYFILAVNY